MDLVKAAPAIKVQKNYRKYGNRTIADSGAITNGPNTKSYIKMAMKNKMYDSIKFAWLGEAGYKQRTSGINTFWTKLYSLVGTTDATQTTSTSQPYLSGNIAPNEKWCIKNPNGGDKYMTHPTISFAANEAWTVSTVFKNNYTNEADPIGRESIFSNNYNSSLFLNWYGKIAINDSNGNVADFGFSSSVDTYKHIGKITSITILYDGHSKLVIYINGQYTSEQNINSFPFIFSTIFGERIFNGSISSHLIFSTALSPSQIASLHSWYKGQGYLGYDGSGIAGVKIGNQVWATSNCEMVATPMGNLIQEMQPNGNVERIVNGGFDVDTDWAKQDGWTISGGVLNANITGLTFAYQIGSAYKYYKVTYTVSNYLGGSVNCIAGNAQGISRTANGTYVEIIKSDQNDAIGFGGLNFIGAIDNVSFQEIGWAGSTELYNGIYAQTAGTVAQKTTAALRAAAFWRYPSNDAATGAVYGKKYNKYALKLLAEDIAAYNTANPSTLWGWDIPTQAQLTTLSSIGGNAAKKEGTTYWNTANGTNSSGLSSIGSGYIAADGTTTNLKSSEYIGCKDADVAREIKDGDNTFNEVAITTEGVSLRLIKV